MDEALRARAEVELGRFFELVAAGVPDLTMPSRAIDEVWHAMLPDAERYNELCLETAGTRVGHGPMAGQGPIEWTPAYEARFGDLDDVWFMDEMGKLDQEARERYRRTRSFVSAWDCGPVPAYD